MPTAIPDSGLRRRNLSAYQRSLVGLSLYTRCSNHAHYPRDVLCAFQERHHGFANPPLRIFLSADHAIVLSAPSPNPYGQFPAFTHPAASASAAEVK